jgi:hypothetical protein
VFVLNQSKVTVLNAMLKSSRHAAAVQSLTTSSSVTCRGVMSSSGALAASLRSFYSGFDDTRVRRLRKTGMQVNKPRGRDALSDAFEGRIHLKPMFSVGDLYAGNDGSASIGSTAVVLPVTSGAEVEASIALPSSCRFHYVSSMFPLRYPSSGATFDRAAEEEEEEERGGPKYPQDMQRFLRKDSDTYCVSLPQPEGVPLSKEGSRDADLLVMVVNPVLDNVAYQRSEAEIEMITAYRNILAEITDWSMGVPLPYEAAALAGRRAAYTHRRRLTTLRVPVLCADTESPGLKGQLAKMTQVAIIKAFQRIAPRSKEHLLFAASAPLSSKNSAAIREEAASVSEVDGADFRVELFVPPHLLTEYQQAFLTDAWAPMTSVFMAPRLDMYSGTPPPEQLAEYDGWVGKRPELLEAIRTKGKSLEGVQYALDGSVIEPLDVMANINPFRKGEVARQIAAAEEATSGSTSVAAADASVQ